VFTPIETTTTTAATTTTTVVVPEGPFTWADTFATLFQQQCSDCHGGSRQLGGLSLATYERAVAGGASGLGIVPGDPDASSLYSVMAAGGHPGQLDAGTVEALRAWIADGADPGEIVEPPPEGETTTTTTTEAVEAGATWQGGVGELIAADCGACHGAAQQLGGVDLSTYESTLAFVVPGDPEESELYEVQVEGGHPGQFDAASLELIREWIAEGALEAQGAEAPPAVEAAGPNWDTDFAPLFTQQCAACHSSSNSMGGVNLASYEDALAWLVPGEPENSPLYTVQAEGGHPGQLEAAALELLGLWIINGAPQSP
jgi:mono/diheme cytochrome c family protein